MTDELEQTKEVEIDGKEASKTKMYDAMPMKPNYGAASFAELMAMEKANEVEEMAEYFPQMVGNIFNRPDIGDKKQAVIDLAIEFVGIVNEKVANAESKEATKETEEDDSDDKAVWSTAFVNDLPDSSFLFIQAGGKKDGSGKTVPRNYRHFPYKDAQGNVDLPHIRNAIARIPQSNAPGLNKRELQDRARKILADAQGKSLDEENLFNRMLGKVKSALGIKDKDETEDKQVYIWKDTNDQYKCILVYSNNFRDNDNPPEIITAESHKGFDEALNKGEWPMPELWLWHVDYPIGHVDFHAYDEKSGFSVAAGTIEQEWAAKALMNSDWDALSHGMPKSEMARDNKDETLIVRHRTKEISFLPKWAAANKLTFHYISKKELDMSDEQKGLGEKRAHFVELIGEDKTAELEQSLTGKSKEANEAGIEQKEADVKQKAETQEEPITRKELAEALTFVLDEIKSLKEQVSKQVEVKEQEEPQDLVALLKAHSVIGAKEAQVDGRTKEAKDAPAENLEKAEQVYGVPLLDNLLHNKQQYALKNQMNIGNMPNGLLAAITEANQQ